MNKYLRKLIANTIKYAEIKEMFIKRIAQENERTTLNQTAYQKSHRSYPKWAVPLVKYSGSHLK